MRNLPRSRVLEAIDALKAFDRRRAAALLRQELAAGPTAGDRWRSVAKLAAKIGEIAIAIEAARRYAATNTTSLDHQLYYWGELAAHGRHRQAMDESNRLPGSLREHPAVLHFQGTIAAQEGDFEKATDLYRRSLSTTPMAPQTWFALSMIKRFSVGDRDLAQMERLAPLFSSAEPSIYARFLFGLGKARHDCGDHERAFGLYAQGAELRRREEPFDHTALTHFVDNVIRDYTPAALAGLRPGSCESDRVIFVTGLPRSGTTLVEQILASHSAILDGAELNLLRPALIPVGDLSLGAAVAFESRATQADPWRELADDYICMLKERFGPTGRLVDKTLCQSHLMGLLLHVLPKAKIIWLRRRPEDSAISTFRTYFTSPLPWTWSLEDIGLFYRQEDRLYQHWISVFPDRILTVPYEDLVVSPRNWIERIMQHAGLAAEPQVFEPHMAKRSVRTASVQQVRAPISRDRIGAAEPYQFQMERFRRIYGC